MGRLYRFAGTLWEPIRKLAHILLVREHSATVVSARCLKKKNKNAGREWIVGHSPQILASEETPPPPHTRTHDNADLTNRTESHTRAHAHHLTIARTRAYTLTIQAGEKIIPVIAQARNRRPRGSSKFVVHVVWQKRKILPTTIATQITSCLLTRGLESLVCRANVVWIVYCRLFLFCTCGQTTVNWSEVSL